MQQMSRRSVSKGIAATAVSLLAVADRLTAMWGTSVIVENIAGAAANIGMDRVAKGPTDGSTLFMVPPQIAAA